MMRVIGFLILFIGINGESLCGDRNATSQPVIDYCKSQNGSLESRCCFQLNTTKILAIDLIFMNLNKVPDINQYPNLINVTVIDLRSNPQLKSSEDDFLGMQSLDYLLLPKSFQCPGEKTVWKIIDETTDPQGVVCQHQKDFCINSTYACTPSNSYCVTNGPNHYLCLCKNGYYGYKCLRYGEFPAIKFFVISIIITLVLCGFFYITHRRHVKRD
jgi:hypothetical protein